MGQGLGEMENIIYGLNLTNSASDKTIVIASLDLIRLLILNLISSSLSQNKTAIYKNYNYSA